MRIVVKVGTSTLAHPTGRLNIQRVEMLVKVLSDLKNAGHTSFAISDSSSGYKMITLDSLKLERLDFMKVDVEGYELNVLKGGEETIKRYRPVIWCEALTDRHKKMLQQYLKSFDYSISRLSDTNFLFLP